MKVNSIKSFVCSSANKAKPATRVSELTTQEMHPVKFSFKGKNVVKDQIAFYGAELPPYSKAGGVATVLKDWQNKGLMFTPFYNCVHEYDSAGRAIGDPKVHTLEDETPVYITADLSKKTVEQAIKDKEYIPLEKPVEGTMQWSTQENAPIAIYKVKDKDHFLVYDEETAKMPKPYAGNLYSSNTSNTKKGFDGDAYFRNCKAFVTLLPKLEETYKTKDGKPVHPQHLHCSDSQATGVAYWTAIKKGNTKDPDNEYFQDMSVAYTGHNFGDGSYCGPASAKTMWVNMGATKEDIENLRYDKDYIDATLDDNEQAYFAKKVELAQGTDGDISAVALALKLANEDAIKAINVVSETYHDDIVKNPKAARPSIHSLYKELAEVGKTLGIMNGFSDDNVSAYKPIGLPGYGKEVAIYEDGTAGLPDKEGKYKNEDKIVEKIPAFSIFKENATLEEARKTKQENAGKLLRRLSGKYEQSEVLAGLSGKDISLIGHIDENWAEKAEKGEAELVVSWGRGDYQKGLDIVLDSWQKFAKTKEGENSVLVLGGALNDDDPEAKKIKNLIEKMNTDEDLKGRFVFMNGFTPGYALASASGTSVFASRFEPCGLTDLEARRYFSTTIVSNTQGFAQKTFDPRIEAEAQKANGYKSTNPYDFLDNNIDTIIKAYNSDDESEKAEVKKIFPDVSEETFETFIKEYNKIADKLENNLIVRGVDKNNASQLTKIILTKDGNDLITAAQNLFKDKESSFKLDAVEYDAKHKYGQVVRTLRDSIMADSLCEAMKARFAHMKDETAEKIYTAMKNSKMGWDDNGEFSKEGKSSWQLYKEKLFSDEPTKGITMPELSPSTKQTLSNLFSHSYASADNW